jgi:multidrug efflux system outer membrane protein
MKRLSLLGALAVALWGCALGPNYRRPSTPMAATFREQAKAEADSLADLPWWQVFHDPTLSALISEALENNYDLKDAAARLEIAHANARIGTDQLWPAVGVQAGASYQRIFSGISIPGLTSGYFTYPQYQLLGTVSWELDLWGRLRRLRESAYAQFFAAEENRRGVIVALISALAQDYFSLLALDLQVDSTNRTVQSRQETLLLFEARQAHGVGDNLDTTAEKALVAEARANLANLQRQIAQTENEISYLAGRLPGPIPRSTNLRHVASPAEPHAGLPATLLERRPDVRLAEAQLVSANAQVGAALAQLFPTVSFSFNGGLESSTLGSLFKAASGTFVTSLVANFLAPVLNGAQYLHQYDGQKAAYQAQLADYRRAVLNAFVEVSDALVAVKTYREQRAQLEVEVLNQTERVRLANLRFRAGVASYLDVVQAEQNLYAAELLLNQTIGAQFASVAQLYRALGGGWKIGDGAQR